MNGGPSSFLKKSRGLRQGDSLSPLLFIIVIKALDKLLKQAREKKLLRDITKRSNSKKLEVTHLFFANDIVIFCQYEADMLLNLDVLICFQVVSDLKVNLNKSELGGVSENRIGNLLGLWATKLYSYQLNVSVFL